MKYPNGIKKKQTHNINYANRGMNLESDINSTNEYYRIIDKAIIYKKPTPLKIVDVNYKSRETATITKAFFVEPSTTDYNGVYKGKYIDFEAKETKSKTSFSLNNIHPHQINHLKNIVNHDGIAFLIIRFTTLNKTFFVLAKDFINYINSNNKKSVPLSFFEGNGYIIKEKLRPLVDYLEIIDEYMEV